MPKIGPYQNSLEHLFEELRRIDLMIHCRVLRMRMKDPETQNEYSGLYIDEAEIESILTAGTAFENQPESDAPQIRSLLDRLAVLENSISERKASSLSEGVELRLMRLQELFRLSFFEKDTLLIAMVPELDLRYERLFAYLQDDVTKKRPSVDVVINILRPSLEARITAREHFAPSAPLLKYQLLELCEDPSQQKPPLLSKYLKLDERTVNYLLDSDALDSRLLPYARSVVLQKRLDDLLLPLGLKERLTKWIDKFGKNKLTAGPIFGESSVFYFQGPYGVGKQSTAEALGRELGTGLLKINLEPLISADPLNFKTVLRLAGREARLQRSVPYWEGFDLLLTDDKKALLAAFLRELDQLSGVTFLAGNKTWEPVDIFHDLPFVRIEFPRTTYPDRIRLWRRFLNNGTPTSKDVDPAALANKFRFSGGQIRDAAATSRNLARWHNPANGHVSMADLHAACRLHSNRKLTELAQKITPLYQWDDIVLPPDRLQQMREICNQVKYHHLVYGDWGFDRKLSMGKGLAVLFAGPSGTGKTMAAEIIAGELDLDLYKIDLSTVVSKYIGETEKNLARIFTEAETSNAILFFDEADALFGKRSEVHDSHDRYANIEISYLLQRMEQYEGVVILATNLQKNMDEAFVRRLHFSVAFPFPVEEERLRIWEGIWPDNTPRSSDLDLGFMAQRFEIPGGNIRNIALAAAFLAATDGRVVDTPHLIGATRREYQKMGKLVRKEEFGEYADHLNRSV